MNTTEATNKLLNKISILETDYIMICSFMTHRHLSPLPLAEVERLITYDYKRSIIAARELHAAREELAAIRATA
jgi:hypothetical protein